VRLDGSVPGHETSWVGANGQLGLVMRGYTRYVRYRPVRAITPNGQSGIQPGAECRPGACGSAFGLSGLG